MLSVYADGSSSGAKKGPGGYGFLILKEGKIVSYGYGGSPMTTNNLQEMYGCIYGLQRMIELGLHNTFEPIELVSDSRYALGMASGAYEPQANQEEAALLKELASVVKCRFRWVAGHSGETYNEYCDVLAKQGKEENTPADVLEAKALKKLAKRAAAKSKKTGGGKAG